MNKLPHSHLITSFVAVALAFLLMPGGSAGQTTRIKDSATLADQAFSRFLTSLDVRQIMETAKSGDLASMIRASGALTSLELADTATIEHWSDGDVVNLYTAALNVYALGSAFQTVTKRTFPPRVRHLYKKYGIANQPALRSRGDILRYLKINSEILGRYQSALKKATRKLNQLRTEEALRKLRSSDTYSRDGNEDLGIRSGMNILYARRGPFSFVIDVDSQRILFVNMAV